jgi:hypothetical protein
MVLMWLRFGCQVCNVRGVPRKEAEGKLARRYILGLVLLKISPFIFTMKLPFSDIKSCSTISGPI